MQSNAHIITTLTDQETLIIYKLTICLVNMDYMGFQSNFDDLKALPRYKGSYSSKLCLHHSFTIHAMRCNNRPAFMMLLKHYLEEGRTPADLLTEASSSDAFVDPYFVDILIDWGFDVNAPDATGCSPLCIAASSKSAHKTRALLRAGATTADKPCHRINGPDCPPPVWTALKDSDVAKVFMEEFGYNPQVVKNVSGEGSFIFAIQSHNIEVIEFVTAQGIRPSCSQVADDGWTPLHQIVKEVMKEQIISDDAKKFVDIIFGKKHTFYTQCSIVVATSERQLHQPDSDVQTALMNATEYAALNGELVLAEYLQKNGLVTRMAKSAALEVLQNAERDEATKKAIQGWIHSHFVVSSLQMLATFAVRKLEMVNLEKEENNFRKDMETLKLNRFVAVAVRNPAKFFSKDS